MGERVGAAAPMVSGTVVGRWERTAPREHVPNSLRSVPYVTAIVPSPPGEGRNARAPRAGACRAAILGLQRQPPLWELQHQEPRRRATMISLPRLVARGLLWWAGGFPRSGSTGPRRAPARKQRHTGSCVDL
jgi:hypothetical protein